jgi:DNA-binding response OmpR family regulator
MKRVLIIEDDQIVGTIYRRKLQLEGFEVSLAADGEAGLAAVSTFHPDIVILDLMLPRLNGVEVLRHLRAQPQNQHLPVIVLSNAYLSNLVQDALNAGANQCLIKANCTPKQILEVIRRILDQECHAPGPAPRPDSLAAPQPPAQPPGTAAPDEGAYQIGLRQAFLADGQETLAQLRAMLQTFVKAEGDTARLTGLFSLYRRALIFALEKANLRCTSIENPLAALALLNDHPFDLILLDVDMPGLNGFELCTRLRAQPTNAQSPVIFVTSLADFESRTRSTLSGGNDLIAKPFLFMELALKAITHILRGKITTPTA